MMPGPSVLIDDHDLVRRLTVTRRLCDGFLPEALPEDADVHRHARSRRPDIVLLFVHPLHPTLAYRACRWMKTDARPIGFVGIVNIGGPPRQPGAVLEFDLADGYFEGPLDLDGLALFVRELWEGRRPVRVAPRPEGMLNRLLRKFVG